MFKELKVLELASVLAGPSVGQFFAELGAEVIKLENLRAGGDVTRSWKISGEPAGDRSAYFCSCNWGKKSVAIDLDTPQGKDIVHKLAARADIVIASYKTGDAEKLGVGYQQLKALQPDLIYGQISGYGPNNDRVGYDAVVQAEAGFMDLNGEKDGAPLKMPVALIDILAAHQLKEGLLLALLNKERTGKGSFVEVSLIQTAVASLANQATNWLVAGKLPSRKGSAHPNIAPYGEAFLSDDGKRILLAIGTDKQFQNLCSVLDIASASDLPTFFTNASRVANRQKLGETLATAIRKWNSAELLARLHQEKIPAGLIQNVKDVFEMREAKDLLLQLDDVAGVRNFVALPTTWQIHSLMPPPHFGEHTKEILSLLGIA